MQISRNIMLRYLASRGWNTQTSRDGGLVRSQLADGRQDPINVFFSTNVDGDQEQREVLAALDTIRHTYRISELEIQQAITGLTHDRVLARVPDEYMRSDSIELRAARSYLNGMRSLITDAAAVEMTGQRFAPKSSKKASDYADRCRFAHTFKGSFGLTIEAPLQGGGQTTIDASEPEPPIGRRVIRRIASGLASLAEAVAEDDPTPIVENDIGFNAEMCKDVLGIIQHSGIPRIDVSIALSPEFKSDGFESGGFKIEARQFSILERAYDRMSDKVNLSTPENISGRIVDLHADGNPADMEDLDGKRIVQVNWDSPDYGMKKVSIGLDPKQYLVALEAHRSGHLVSAVGTLRRKRSWVLEEVQSFHRLGPDTSESPTT